MTTGRKKLLKEYIETIQSFGEQARISVLNGGFGIGKSEFLDVAVEELNSKGMADAICYFDYHFDKDFLVDYLTSFELSIPDSDATAVTYNFDETTYNKQHLRDLLDIVWKNDSELFNQLLVGFTPVYYNVDDLPHMDEKELEDRLAKFIENRGDIRFLINHYRVITESFLVDLMSLFYPVNDSYPNLSSYLKNLVTPVKIMIIHDNIDCAAGTIAEWLNDELLPLFLDGKFGDLISYDIDDELKEVEISKFFEFYFIASSRIRLDFIEDLNYFKKNEERIYNIHLPLLTFDETKEYLEERKIDQSKTEQIYSYSFGMPFLIDLLIEYEVDEINEVVRDSIYDTFTEKILDGRDEAVQEAIKMSAFIGEFDEDFLRCNRQIGDNYKKVFDYLKFTNDLYSQNKNKISLSLPFKKIMTMSLERNFKSDVIEYGNIARTYSAIKEKYPKLNSEELNILRSFAYFNSFDMELAIEMAFDDKSSAAKNFVKMHKEFFISNNHTKSLKDEHKVILDSYNKIIDRQKYELKKQLITNIWNEREKQLKSDLENYEKALVDLENEAVKYGDDPSKIKQEYDKLQKQFIEKENDFIALRKKMETYSYNKYIFSLIVNITAAVMSFIIGFFFSDLFSTPKNHSSIIFIQYILYFIALVFLFIGINFVYKIIKAILNKKGMQKLNEEIKMLEDERLGIQDKMKELKSIFVDWQKNVNEINKQIRNNKEQIKRIREILDEKYILL